MNKKEELLLNELKEHTSDSDCARKQHFYMYHKSYKCARRVKELQVFMLILAIVLYMTYFFISPKGTIHPCFVYAANILAILTMVISLCDYIFDIRRKVVEHWKAAQVYLEIYRKCQFFSITYYNSTEEVWVEKLRDISEELSRAALFSPHLDPESYEAVKSQIDTSNYRVNFSVGFSEGKNNIDINRIVKEIKRIFSNHNLDIYLYGSYVNSILYKDIDIAIIVYDALDIIQYSKKVVDLECRYLRDNIFLDIQIVLEKEIGVNKSKEFISNIKKGELLFSNHLKKEDDDNIDLKINYDEGVRRYCDEAYKSYNGGQTKCFVNYVYYMYYNCCAYLLNNKGVSWNGEIMLIQKIHSLAFSDNNDDLLIIIENMKYVKKLKDASFLELQNRSKQEIDYVKELYDDSLNNNLVKSHLNANES